MPKNIQDNKNIDSDADGLSDWEEINIYHTDPNNPDTDRDGVNDGDEVKQGTNPRGKGLLHDLFIPSHYNNYKPKALHTKRLVFYSFAAIAIKALVVVLALSFPIQAWLTPDLLSGQSERIVELTNNLRAGLNLNILRNSEVLQQAALSKAEDMLVNQYFAHVSPEKKGLKYWLQSKNYNYSVAGENLALGFSEPEAVIQAWKDSPTHYANLVDPDYKDIGVAMIAGNYQGYDTTLVAQHFGTLKIEPKTEVTEPIVVITDDILTATSTSQTSTNAVLANKDLPEPSIVLPVIPVAQAILVAPRLISPADNFLIKDTNVHFIIDAPKAEELIVWVNKKPLLETQLSTEKIETDLVLSEGENEIILQANGQKQSIYSPSYTIKVDITAPQVDQERTEISALQANGQDDVVIKAEAYISSDTKTASIKLGQYNISLQQDSFDQEKWTGHLILNKVDYQNFSSPIVLATLTAVDLAGNTAIEDINWGAVVPKEASPLSQYLFLKNNRSNYTASLFDISSIYYKFVLVLACMALLLNIFIEVKKQHPKTIASTMCFIALLVVLIII